MSKIDKGCPITESCKRKLEICILYRFLSCVAVRLCFVGVKRKNKGEKQFVVTSDPEERKSTFIREIFCGSGFLAGKFGVKEFCSVVSDNINLHSIVDHGGTNV